MSDQKKLRAAHIEHMRSIGANYAITLCAGLSCPIDTLRRGATLFLNRMQKQVLGRKWHLRDGSDRIAAIGFFEHPDSNLHLHIAARLPSAAMQQALEAGEREWRAIRKAGAYECQPIDELERWTSYITKDLWDRRTGDPFEYSDGGPRLGRLRIVKWNDLNFD